MSLLFVILLLGLQKVVESAILLLQHLVLRLEFLYPCSLHHLLETGEVECLLVDLLDSILQLVPEVNDLTGVCCLTVFLFIAGGRDALFALHPPLLLPQVFLELTKSPTSR